MIKTPFNKIKMNKIVFNIIIFLLFLLFLVGSSELILRLLGYSPLSFVQLNAKEPVMLYDPVLGWKTKQGVYRVPPYSSSGKTIEITILDDGSRATSKDTSLKTQAKKGDIVVIGCSYTMGWAISDKETFAWKLQERFPEFKVRNYGTGGYGTYQSLLSLENYLARSKPKLVIYGFVPFHDERNVVGVSWIMTLINNPHKRPIYIPYVEMNAKGNIVRKPTEKYFAWPLIHQLALVTLAENAYLRIKTFKRESYKKEATAKLILKLNETAKRSGSEFAVAVLYPLFKDHDYYMALFKRNDIDVINAAIPLLACYVVEGEVHPNGELNALWSEIICGRAKLLLY